MSTRRTDDGTYPNVDEELAKLEERALGERGAREPYGPAVPPQVRELINESYRSPVGIAGADVAGPYRAVADAERAARAAREPLETEEHDAGDERRGACARCGATLDSRARCLNATCIAGTSADEDLERVVRRAEVRLDPIYIEGPSSEAVALVLEDFADGSSELVVLALDGDEAELEIARVDAALVFSAIDRLRAFATNPNPPRERTLGDVNRAIESLLADAGPVLLRAIGVSPLRPIPGGRK
jgi:hypothetical protein